MNENEILFLQLVCHSLNTIEVKGKNNLDVLLGCITAIENQITVLKSASLKMEETPDE